MKTPNKWSIRVMDCWSVSNHEHHSITPRPQSSVTPLLGWALPALLLCGISSRCFAQCCAPMITNQPQSQSVIIGTTVDFSVAVNSTTFPTYQWRFNGTNIAGATATNYTIYSAQPTNAGNYSVAVTNQAGWTISSNASLTVLAPSSVFAW